MSGTSSTRRKVKKGRKRSRGRRIAPHEFKTPQLDNISKAGVPPAESAQHPAPMEGLLNSLTALGRVPSAQPQQELEQPQQPKQGPSPTHSVGTGSGGAGKRTLPPQQRLSPFATPPAAHDAFLSRLEEAEVRDEHVSQVLSGKTDGSYLTPVRNVMRTPQPYQQTGGAPGAPSSNKAKAFSRTEQAREFIGNVASNARAATIAAWTKGPREIVEGVKAGLERARNMSPLGKYSSSKAARTPSGA